MAAQAQSLPALMRVAHKAAHAANPTARTRQQPSPRPQLNGDFDIFLGSAQLGRPEMIIRQRGDNLTGYSNAYVATLSYTAAGRPDTIVYRDSSSNAIFGRRIYSYTPSGKIASIQDEDSNFEPTFRERYTYDSRDSVAREFSEVAGPGGTWITSFAIAYGRTFDAQNRLTAQIDSGYDDVSGQFVASFKLEFNYQGTAQAPNRVDIFDTAAGAWEQSARLANITWIDFARFRPARGDLQIQAPILGWITLGRLEGVLTGRTYVLTTSQRSSPIGPLEPSERTTETENAQGDRTLTRDESYDATNSTWTVDYEEATTLTYNRAGSNLSSRETVTNSGGTLTLERFFFADREMAARPTATTVALAVRPNPATGQTWVQGPAGAQAQLVTPTGRVVRRFSLLRGATPLSLQGLPPGLYLVQVGRASVRLVVE